MNSLFACSSTATKYSMLSVSSSGMTSTCVYRNKSFHLDVTKEMLRYHVVLPSNNLCRVPEQEIALSSRKQARKQDNLKSRQVG